MSEHLKEPPQFKICRHARNCSGCFYFGGSFSESLVQQQQGKTEFFFSEMKKQGVSFQTSSVEYKNPSPLFYRNHLDFVLDHGKMGLYHHESKSIADISECLVLHPRLLDFYQQFRRLVPQDLKGSFRLRFDGNQKFGAWLDFANLDIKKLLEEKTFLNELLALASVEMGQRGKSVQRQGDQLKLVDPLYYHWFRSKTRSTEIPLNSLIRSFTQSGIQNNFSIIEEIQNFYRKNKIPSNQKALEMGSGIGNLTFPFLEFFQSIDCIEFDEVSLNGFSQTLKEQQISPDQVHLIHGDFHREKSIDDINLDSYNALILNPARSGVGGFLEKLKTNQTIQTIFLMSCYTESFATDAALIQQAGFNCHHVILFDQFSMSKHFEILSFWSR